MPLEIPSSSLGSLERVLSYGILHTVHSHDGPNCIVQHEAEQVKGSVKYNLQTIQITAYGHWGRQFCIKESKSDHML